jgi:hypothetical protein
VLRRSRVGVEDPFLDLGGHSILAAQVQARLAEVFPSRSRCATCSRPARSRSWPSTCARSRARRAWISSEICRTLRALGALSDDEVRERLASNS